MSTYLVTGGAGFIGSHLAEELIKLNHRVIVLDNLSNGFLENISEKAEFIEGDILDTDLVNKVMRNVDGCFHLAAIPSITECTKNWSKAHQINATGTVNVLNAARPDVLGRQIPVVFASSCAVYGKMDLPKNGLNETVKVTPLSGYGADKLASELYVHVAFEQFNIPTVCLRLFNVYGSRQRSDSPYSGVISIFADKLKKNEPVTIYGDGNQIRDFIYVKDVVSFFIKAMNLNHQSALVMNACTGKTTTINDLFGTMAKIIGGQSTVAHAPSRSDDIYASCGDPSYAKKILDFQAQFTLQEGLKEFL